VTAACVIDASVAIKWVITEDGTQAANRLRWTGIAFHVPELIVPETGNILWKKVQRGELTRVEAELAAEILTLAKIERHPTGSHTALALRMALEMQHPVYETTYLALARALDVPMITADRRLVHKVAAMRHSQLPEVGLLR
jgi:predicted nucleic acid-binding protein